MTVKNSRFHDFDFGMSAALGVCSHCFHPASSNGGGWTYSVENLSFTNTPRRIKYNIPFREVIYDMDGSLTGLGAGSWAVSTTFDHVSQPHLVVSEC